MIEGSVTVLADRLGSVWGRDGRYYPSTEEPEVPLSGAAIQLILYLCAALRHVLYTKHDRVYVGADQFIYYRPYQPSVKIAPDIWVCYGVPKRPEREVFRTWEEGAVPTFVAEISSTESRPGDRGTKLSLYQNELGCCEYLLYDEPTAELILYRRQGDAFEAVPSEVDGRVYSQELGVWFAPDPELLVRVFDESGEAVAATEELYERVRIEERIRKHAEEEAAAMAALAEQERQRADELAERAAAERARGEELAAANAQLRAELERLRQSPRE